MADESVQVFHFRCRDPKDNRPFIKGGATVVVRRTDKGLEAAYALCSAQENYNPVEGEKKAKARLFSKPKKGMNTKLKFWPIGANYVPIDYYKAYPYLRSSFEEVDALAQRGVITLEQQFAWHTAVMALDECRGGKLEDIVWVRNNLSPFPQRRHIA